MKAKAKAEEVARYAANGFVATSVHYMVLYSCVEILNFRLIGLANLLASIFGILFSFMGNKYFVFKSSDRNIGYQLALFISLYALVAFIHGAFLYIWSDVMEKNYNHGFIVAVIIQLLLGYLASKYFVFNRTAMASRS